MMKILTAILRHSQVLFGLGLVLSFFLAAAFIRNLRHSMILAVGPGPARTPYRIPSPSKSPSRGKNYLSRV